MSLSSLFRKILIILLLIVNFCMIGHASEKYCFVSFDSPAIILNSTEGKDRTYEESKFDHHASLLNISETMLKNSKWSLINSLSATENQKTEGFVLDQRWEYFIYNSRGPVQISNIVRSMRNLSTFAISIKPYNGSTPDMDPKPSWHHFFVKKTNQDTYTFNETIRDFNETLSFKTNMWRIHNYNYFCSGNSTNEPTVIYHGQNNCWQNNIKDRCVYFYLAMCSDCMLNIELMDLTSNNTNNANFTATKDREWKQVKICHKMSQCFQISIKTWSNSTNSSDGFWALGQEIYLSNCTNPTRYLSYKTTEASIKGCERVDTNEKITETDVKDLSCLDDSSRKKGTTTETPTTKSPENITNNRIMVKPTQQTKEETSILPYFTIPIGIVLALLLLFAIIYFIWKKQNNTSLHFAQSHDEPDTSKEEIELLSVPNGSRGEKYFVQYVQKAFDNSYDAVDLLKAQFESLPRNYLKAHVCGGNPENRGKNVYPKIIAYDDTRVILRRLDTEDTGFTGNYINANYVEGLRGKNEYIITQNPLLGTVKDFWRMIWQENISHIVMLSTIGQKDFVKYWPDQLDGILYYGDFEVTLMKVERHEFYSYRELKLRYRSKIKCISQYHFNWWFKPNMPCFPHILVKLVNDVLMFPRENPILIHCHAGIGRSGIIVLCDLAIQLIDRNEQIDMHKLTKKLRECRYRLVENANLYKLAHLTIVEYLLYRKIRTSLAVEDFGPDHKKWSRSSLEAFKILQDFNWINEAIVPLIYVNDCPEKNRYPGLRPLEHSRVIVQHFEQELHINAHFVDGYRLPEKYIVTQQPLQNTVEDFWSMIVQQRVLFIVNLQEIDRKSGNHCSFFPTSTGHKLEFPNNLTVTCRQIEINPDFNKLTLEVNCNRIVHTIFCIDLKKWLGTCDVPKYVDPLIEIWVMMHLMKTDEIAVICCDDGVRASGLFVGLCYFLDKARAENAFDAVSAVKAIRRSHPKFITQKQFDFMLKAATNGFKRMTND